MSKFFGFMKQHTMFLVVAVAMIGVVTASGVWWWYQPVALDFAHSSCEISYGDEIGSWRGDSDAEWNQNGMVYVARSFSLSQEVEGSYRPNAYYRSLHRIQSSGDEVCDEEFDDYIDTESDYYRWNGARAEEIRVGVPLYVRENPEVDVPVFARQTKTEARFAVSDEVAADELPLAWAEDGGRAAAVTHESDVTLLWCIGDPGCDFAPRNQDVSGLGPSFYFASDGVCGDTTCEDGRVDLDNMSFPKDGNSFVEPFQLKMSATSEIPPVTAAETVLVFSYSVAPDVSVRAVLSGQELQAQDEVELMVTASSSGPRLSEGSVSIDIDEQPLRSENTQFDFNDDALEEIHNGEIIRSFSLVVDDNVAPGACYVVPVVIEVLSVEGDSARIEEALSYCIESAPKMYTYSVATRGGTVSSLSDFSQHAAETLADSRGWVQGGVQFERVSSGGDFTLWLAAPDQMTSFSSLCSAEYSCRVGRDVVVNDLRWREATDPWNEAGESIRDYRHMVVNHEVGHLLGFGHYNCPGAGQLAPVMLQQSIDLQGCRFNPWPLKFEIDALTSL